MFRFLAPEPGIALLLIIPSVLYSRFERCRSCKRRIRVSRCEGKDRSDFEAYAFLTIRVQHLVTFSSIRRRCALPQGPTASIVVDQLSCKQVSSLREGCRMQKWILSIVSLFCLFHMCTGRRPLLRLASGKTLVIVAVSWHCCSHTAAVRVA